MRVKGNQIKPRVMLVKNEYGEDVFENVLKALTKEDQKLFGGIILSGSWFSFDSTNRLDKAIIKITGLKKKDLYIKLGRSTAKETLNGVHRNFLIPREPMAFIKKVNLIYRFYYDSGRHEWEAESPNSVFISTLDATSFSEGSCLTNMGYFSEGLEMCGAKNVKFVKKMCREKGDKMCRHHVSWA